MNKIRIDNFGPIKGSREHDGWIECRKVTLFIGEQGSGKSTAAKLLSTFSWVEKTLVRGDYDVKWFTQRNRFRKLLLAYHRLENYLKKGEADTSEIEYEGAAYRLHYRAGSLSIEKKPESKYRLPQIMYVPAERNFISYIRSPKVLKMAADSLKDFLAEYQNACMDLSGPARLPIHELMVEYDRLNDVVNLRGRGHKVKLLEASSGYQSLVPLALVSQYLATRVKGEGEVVQERMSSEELERFTKAVRLITQSRVLTDEQRRAALGVLFSKFAKSAFMNIVEEPEQNLYPESQWAVLLHLLELNNYSDGNSLLMTTHSPYMLHFLGLAIQGKHLDRLIGDTSRNESAWLKLDEIVSRKSLVAGADVRVYQFSGAGEITRLEDYKGIPGDDNMLNSKLKWVNDRFDALLEIEQEYT